MEKLSVLNNYYFYVNEKTEEVAFTWNTVISQMNDFSYLEQKHDYI